ncbi:MAG TPA: gamma-glutamyl-gamma-aminobutyrate hydrolase family protein, partial [Vicinamibacteria bacterium]|nr:gamma-glutamyl-gamma-aminobutyrate hydrolase family protein [Vicinamibacteria bacterium]
MERDTIAILDFGSQYTQLIARRFREMQVYSEILPPGTKPSALRARPLRGIVLSGGPDSVHERRAPRCDPGVFSLDVPVLGICYGMQLMSHMLGGEVRKANRSEYGNALFEK